MDSEPENEIYFESSEDLNQPESLNMFNQSK